MTRRPTLSMALGALCLAACGGDPASPDAGRDGIDGGAPTLDAGGALPNLTVSAERAQRSARVVWQYFSEGDCVIAEGCVEAAGWRRLLRFETFTPNVGDADFRMGPPSEHPEYFEYSSCHEHYHYEGYADYRLLDGAGAMVATGHKQAFCLMDTEPVASGPGIPTEVQYDCSNQGISRGWGDSYYPALDCQWVDVTAVDPGDYVLRIAINGARTIAESSYDDNVAMVPVTIPADGAVDPTAACARVIDGPRDCGWTLAGSYDCEPGRRYRVGCGAGCGLGSCGEGEDALLRVCEGDAPCSSRTQLAYGDDGCGDSYCPLTTFTCPAGGRYTVLTAPYLVGDALTCTPGAQPMP